ncbi:MAG TPA: potassium channel family protein [Verrucomicrobiaceae bacterium]|jgi:hypothetical protein
MISKLLTAFVLLALCVLVHTSGLAFLFRRSMASVEKSELGVVGLAGAMIKIASWLLFLHLCEIAIWAVFYWWRGCLPDLETAVYFSAVTYATVGYGDVVLPMESRMLGPFEGLSGILMCSLSTGFFFLAASRLYASATPARGENHGGGRDS